MSKISGFNISTQRQIDPSLPVAAELVRRGAEVICYLAEGQRQRIEVIGATCRAYDAT